MCGIVGILNQREHEPVQEEDVLRMLAVIRHRGPDECGMHLDACVGLGNARLSIIDLRTGQQPIATADATKWIVFNGEIFNYRDLRRDLEARGHHFRTESDTEVLLHLYDEFGPSCLERINGQFAFAVWDTREQTLFLARDRLGICPLFYTSSGGRLIFGSEIKAILTQRYVRAELDAAVLGEVFTYWAPLPPRTIFRGILEIPPGHYLVARHGGTEVKRYWELSFPEPGATGTTAPLPARAAEECMEEFSSLLIEAVKTRLLADVPVGAYLSGGLDSSTVAAIVRNFTSNRLSTFSIAFSDMDYDESAFQTEMARSLGAEHQVARVSHADIGRVFPDVIWHTEVPVMRTAPAPMFLLSELVRNAGFKVVLTGEGADEFLAGYDIFKETKIRSHWARQPNSSQRPKLLRRLYADIPNLARSADTFRAAFFKQGLLEVDTPDYSHAIRWRNNRRTCRFFSQEVLQKTDPWPAQPIAERVGGRCQGWTPLARAQHLEITVFLSHYLLSSQADRVAMAHSIEARFPFLDHRLTAFCNHLPEHLKLRGLTEKYLLRKVAQRWLPPGVWRRRKRPYRAPISPCFLSSPARHYVRELLSPGRLRATGLFQPDAVARLTDKLEQGGPVSETDEMALVGIISTQLLHHQFVAAFDVPRSLPNADSVRLRSNLKPSTPR